MRFIKNHSTEKFIYGTEQLRRLSEYNSDDDYTNADNNDNDFCSNDCLRCIIECPYKEY